MNRHPLTRTLFALPLLVLLTPLLVGAPSASVASTGPAGFSDSLVLSLPFPTGMVWTPDGRMLLTQDTGQVRVVRSGGLKPTPALALGARLCSGGERGLAGIVVDPAFASNRYVYLYWSHNRFNYCGNASSRTPRNRVTRYILGDNDIIDPASEKVLVDWIKSPITSHNGGDLHFGVDGLLYISTGDGGCTIGDPTRCAALNTNSRRMDIANGKILRITRDGAIPATNPFVSAPGARHCTNPVAVPAGAGPCTETFASGFRNPYRFVQRPGTNAFLINDVGQAHWRRSTNSLPARTTAGTSARATAPLVPIPTAAPRRTRIRSSTTTTRTAAPQSPAGRSSRPACGRPRMAARTCSPTSSVVESSGSLRRPAAATPASRSSPA